MPLRFRNIDTTPDAPVREWGFEGMLAALDRGYAPHWSRLASAVASEPQSPGNLNPLWHGQLDCLQAP